MKIPRLQDVFYWRNKVCKVIGLSSDPMVHFVECEPNRCPHCEGLLDPVQHSLVVSAPIFQADSQPVQTIIDNQQFAPAHE